MRRPRRSSRCVNVNTPRPCFRETGGELTVKYDAVARKPLLLANTLR